MFKPEQVFNYIGMLRQEKDSFWGLYEEAFFWTRPQDNTYNSKSQGDTKGITIYDSTAEEATDVFAYRYQNALMPSEIPWCKFILGKMFKKQILEKNGKEAGQALIDEIEIKLQDQTEIFHEYFNRSNLPTQYRESFKDLAIGTFACLINEVSDPNMPFEATSIPLHTVMVGESAFGLATDFARDLTKRVNDIKTTWPNAVLNEELQKLIINDRTAEVELIECCLYDRDKNEWCYYVMHGAFFMVKQVYKTNPYVIYRYTTNSEESLGRGPAIIKLADIKSLNKMREFRLKGLSRAAGGIFLARDDNVMNPYLVNFEPDTVIPVDDTENSVRELPYQGRPDVMEWEIKPLQESVKAAYYASDISPIDDPVRSATEVVIKNQRDLERQRGGYQRGKSELLDATVRRIVDILVRRGIMDAVMIDKKVISFQYTGPLAMAQDKDELGMLAEAVQTSMALVGPEVTAQVYNLPRIAKAPADLLGVNKQLLNTPEEQQKMAQQQQEMAQAQAQGGAQ